MAFALFAALRMSGKHDSSQRGLSTSVFSRDASGVRAALRQGADPNSAGPSMSFLTFAATWCDVPVVKELLAAGADVNSLDPNGLSPLHCVTHCSMGDASYQIAELLIAHGADVNLQSANGETPLAMAASAVLTARDMERHGNIARTAAPRIFRLLLDNGASPTNKRERALVDKATRSCSPHER